MPRPVSGVRNRDNEYIGWFQRPAGTVKHAVHSLASGKQLGISEEYRFQRKQLTGPVAVSAAEIAVCDAISFLLSPWCFSCLHFFLYTQGGRAGLPCSFCTNSFIFLRSALNLVAVFFHLLVCLAHHCLASMQRSEKMLFNLSPVCTANRTLPLDTDVFI